MVYLFVYGTLLSNSKHPMYEVLINEASFVSKGFFQGKLYDLGQYPGAIESTEAADQVTGEVYLLHNLSVLEKLDEYEGFSDINRANSLFVRKNVPVLQENGHTIYANIYLYNFTISQVCRINSGNYALYKQKQNYSPV